MSQVPLPLTSTFHAGLQSKQGPFRRKLTALCKAGGACIRNSLHLAFLEIPSFTSLLAKRVPAGLEGSEAARGTVVWGMPPRPGRAGATGNEYELV